MFVIGRRVEEQPEGIWVLVRVEEFFEISIANACIDDGELFSE
jgi:hypothetical protein